MKEERALVRRASRGDAEAFRVLVETYQTQVYRLALRICGESGAEDAAQEAFLSAWRALPRFRGECQFSTWLYRLTANAAVDYLRREKKQRTDGDIAELDPMDDSPTPQERAEQSDTRQRVQAALAQLTREHREILLLRYMQELDYGEIAAALGISEGTVKSRISRAKGRLREILARDGNLFPTGAVKETERREQP